MTGLLKIPVVAWWQHEPDCLLRDGFQQLYQGPLHDHSIALSDDNYVSNCQISSWLMPLVVFVKPCEILNRSPFPEVSLANSYTVAIAEGGIQYDMRVWSPEENSGWPIRECPDVRASVPSSSLFIATKGRLFRHGSICARSVTISSKVSLVSPMTHLGCVFALLTLSTTSHRPPKCRPVQV